MTKKALIVGGVAGGASTAARLRRLDENIEIIIFERDEYISFANCGLPYYIGETIDERDKLLVQTPKSMKDRFNIDVRINSEVIKVNVKEKTLSINSKEKGIYEESYDYLVLSPGAKPIRPNIEGINNEKIFTLRNIPDTDSIKAYVDKNETESAVVIGGGYIGVEMAENLSKRGLEVTLVEAAPHILAPFDSDMVTIAEKELEDHGVSLILEDGVKSFNNNEGKVSINLSSGKKLDADMVILAIGVIPDTGFLRDTGIEFGDKGHIVVDKYMNTNVEDVYAVGDAILVKDFINGNSTAIPLAGPANRQGRIVADNIYGIKSEYKGTLGTSIIKVFDMAAASTGNNERNLKKLQIPYKVIYAHPNSHAGYYPGAVMMSIKLIFNEEGKILGSQILGYDGVDKTIDVIATVIKLNGTVKDLTELELAYAPPYSSAKSPANMMGFIAENVLEDRMDILNIEDINDFNQNKEILLDVRDQVEVENGSIDKAINIPVNDLRNRMNELDKEKEIWVYCRVGLRGYIASRILTQNGFKVKNLTGGYESIKKADFKPLEINKSNIKDDDKTLIKLKDKEFDKEIDASGLCCPGPLMSLKNSMDKLEEGKILSIKASDPGFYEDVQSWCKNTGNQLLDLKREGGMIKAYIKKKPKEVTKDEDNKELVSTQKDGKTMVVFSGELDKAIASFIIANGAASMGKKVTMFFTFWGINILRKDEKVPTKKKFMEKAFGFMMPRGSKKLKLSNMNMAGMGPKVIRKLMQDKNVSSLEELITAAIDSGIEIVACQMSMDLLGLKKEELIDGVKIAGVGYYLGEAEESNVNLFI
ncbi:CoA-disulfide reductase [Clostridium algidicarnis]|uniref:CoA-disulfide reductase n=1 Tax=Clostridium algidicarnis TaxID=37659 RepID=UPI001C0E1F4F|nr:CoA-disulfide reductase [Clostridium algidicarnis]MBU3192710.1 CoA-disulfide reductase [Clostridium algidicarnis]MBU3204035.1 CoA-disulfide reductase [Clostridium algidicarnis]MBU3212189.1 CoA-disulfide reductase [Clostridium algidicarnis]MBU3221306.1 CoA-disulfide reductase [Clostridium algidicarnis]